MKYLRAFLAGWVGLALWAGAVASAPAWWAQRGVLRPDVPASDYAAANVGQAKRIATLAAEEMQVKLPGGAGPRLTALIASWSLPPAPGLERNDYAAINVGQLKALAQPFYDRLAEVKYSGPPLAPGQRYPWTSATTDDVDYAIANVGQVKFLFSFDPGLVDVTPPVIVSLTATPSVLSPPTRKMIPVAVTAVVSDAVDPSPVTRIISVSFAPEAKGKPSDDYVITGPLAVNLRAEADGKGDRVYSIVVESRDRSNNAATRTVTVTVPRGK